MNNLNSFSENKESEEIQSFENIKTLKDFNKLIKIKNPLSEQNSENLKKVLKQIVNKFISGENAYMDIQRIGIENKHTGMRNKIEAEKFDNNVFSLVEEWQEKISNTDNEVLKKYITKQLKINNDFCFKEDILKRYNDLKYYSNSNINSTIQEFKSFRPDGLSMYTPFYNDHNWTYINTYPLYLKDNINIAHRFYLNSDSIITHKIINDIINISKEKEVPILLKFDENGKRADTICVYVSDKYLIKTIDILKEIIQNTEQIEDEELQNGNDFTCLYEPPILTANLGKIGYGAENQGNASALSYTETRIHLLNNSIEKIFSNSIEEYDEDKISEVIYNEIDNNFEELFKKIKEEIKNNNYCINPDNFASIEK